MERENSNREETDGRRPSRESFVIVFPSLVPTLAPRGNMYGPSETSGAADGYGPPPSRAKRGANANCVYNEIVYHTIGSGPCGPSLLRPLVWDAERRREGTAQQL